MNACSPSMKSSVCPSWPMAACRVKNAQSRTLLTALKVARAARRAARTSHRCMHSSSFMPLRRKSSAIASDSRTASGAFAVMRLASASAPSSVCPDGTT